MNRSQGSFLVPSKSWSKVAAGKEPRWMSTRSPVRSRRLSRGMSAGCPWQKTRPLSARTSCMPIRRSSSAAIPSTPNRVGITKVSSFTGLRSSLFPSIGTVLCSIHGPGGFGKPFLSPGEIFLTLTCPPRPLRPFSRVFRFFSCNLRRYMLCYSQDMLGESIQPRHLPVNFLRKLR